MHQTRVRLQVPIRCDSVLLTFHLALILRNDFLFLFALRRVRHDAGVVQIRWSLLSETFLLLRDVSLLCPMRHI